MPPVASSSRAIRIAVLAMGGEGGGVLADWIVDLGETGGYIAQTTSVPGVAQRTGATIYYIELFPRRLADAAGREPVLALMPVPGDVDIVIASELMEAARAVERGLVTPDRTVLIASTHRVYAMTEKIALGDGRSQSAPLLEACRRAARRLVATDMAAIAEESGSVISAALLGALAGSAALPFTRDDFLATIRRGGVGVEASIRAFELSLARTMNDDAGASLPSAPATAPVNAAPAGLDDLASLDDLVRLDHLVGRESWWGEAGEELRTIVGHALPRLVDYQDEAYARLYLERLRPIAGLARDGGENGTRLLAETARQLALAMTYEDTIRIADLKTRPERRARIAREVRAGKDDVLEIAEFLHPRLQEIAETVPAPLGRFITDNRAARAVVTWATRKGRIVTTTGIRGHLLLSAVAALKSRRRRSLRFAAETRAIEGWLDRIAATAPKDCELAIAYAEARNLVKGYGDTHARGLASFRAITAALDRLERRSDAAARLRRLTAAALADDSGKALAAELASLDPAPQGG
ncbi:MAG: indolepyruvate oxidoreductase subunit beta family protein [Hyphomicrobiaceae bacterium]